MTARTASTRRTNTYSADSTYRRSRQRRSSCRRRWRGSPSARARDWCVTIEAFSTSLASIAFKPHYHNRFWCMGLVSILCNSPYLVGGLRNIHFVFILSTYASKK